MINKILNAVIATNDEQKLVLAHKILSYFHGDLHGKKIAVWGLSFKPNTDDIREAPALYIIPKLIEAGASVICFDPEGMKNTKEYFEKNHKELCSQLSFGEDIYAMLQDADALAICTEWTIFRTPDFEQMKVKLKAPVIFDGRNLYDLEEMKSTGFYYESIGRKIISLS